MTMIVSVNYIFHSQCPVWMNENWIDKLEKRHNGLKISKKDANLDPQIISKYINII
jgi:hypothetical protein